MTNTYFGLICPQCNAGYPLGNEMKRDWRYNIGDLRFLFSGSGWQLTCVRCGAITVSDNLASWTPTESYTAAQMAAARLRVRQVSRKTPKL